MGSFGYTEEEQAQHPVATIICPKFDVFPPKYGAQLRDIRWRHDFEHEFGIVDYTRTFIGLHEQRGVVLARHTVEVSWVEKVANIFEDDEDKKDFLVSQVRTIAILGLVCTSSYTHRGAYE